MLNLKNILHEILNEDVSPREVNDAIDNKIQVVITYSDDKNRAPNKRLIEPYAYGRSKAGNSVFRAFQYDGDTFRGKPKWKLFRLDRVTSWNPTENHFNAEPKERNWTDKAYNEQGDDSMSTVLNMVKFDYDETSNNPYEKGSDLYNIRKKTDNMKMSKPININTMDRGPVSNQNTQNNSNVNVDNNIQRGPLTEPDMSSDNFQKLNNQQNNNTETTTDKEDEFQKMLRRNLAITDKEKQRRGFSLNNNVINN